MVGIGFFAPFPLALMVPFMAGQSLAMGEAFGKGFQYGKRKISSMSNEEFNKLDFQQLSESIATDYKLMIPSLKQSILASKELQDAVFDALGKLILDIPENIKEFMSSLVGGTGTGSAQETSLVLANALGKLTEVRSAGRTEPEFNTQQLQDLLDKVAKASVAGAQKLDQSAKNTQAAINEEKRRVAALAERTHIYEEEIAKPIRTVPVANKRKATQSAKIHMNTIQKKLLNALKESKEHWKGKNHVRAATVATATFQRQIDALMSRYQF